jgi:hypothetical protein
MFVVLKRLLIDTWVSGRAASNDRASQTKLPERCENKATSGQSRRRRAKVIIFFHSHDDGRSIFTRRHYRADCICVWSFRSSSYKTLPVSKYLLFHHRTESVCAFFGWFLAIFQNSPNSSFAVLLKYSLCK